MKLHFKVFRLYLLLTICFRNDPQSYSKWTEYLDKYGNSDQSIFPDYQPTTMTFTTENLEKVELYRYWGSIGLFSLYVLLILLSFIAICCRSKVLLPSGKVYELSFQGNDAWCYMCPILRIGHLSPYTVRSVVNRSWSL